MGSYARGGSSPLSDTRLNYTRSGFDDDPAVVVVGDVDPQLGVDLGLVCRVGCDQRCGEFTDVELLQHLGEFLEAGGCFCSGFGSLA